MNVVEIPLDRLCAAGWSPNTMGATELAKLKTSVTIFDIVENMVVRPVDENSSAYEVLAGNQRLDIYREMGLEAAPCVVVNLNDANARLLAQTLNRLHGEDDLGLKAELVRTILAELPEAEVLKILPETPDSLHDLADLGEQDLAEQLRAWQQAQAARLKHLQFQLTESQLEIIEEALSRVLPLARQNMGDKPERQGHCPVRAMQGLSGIRSGDGMITQDTRGLKCHICRKSLSVRLARGRRSGKPFVMLVCPSDGRHLRAFVADANYVSNVIERLEATA